MPTPDTTPETFTAFKGHTQVASGPIRGVAAALRDRIAAGESALILIFDDQTGRQRDIDLSATARDVAGRFGESPDDPSLASGSPSGSKRRGRPKLGVIGREVTLLPRHWEWLQDQRGGPSATIRRLVDAARATHREHDRVRAAQDAINRFISAVAGDLAGFEEANRALYRGDPARFEQQTASWPGDVRRYIARWSEAAFAAEASEDPSERA